MKTKFDRVPIEVSARHVHLSRRDFTKLFGRGNLTVNRNISQPGQFVAQQTVDLLGPKGHFTHVAIVGPWRSASQVELTRTDGYQLGIQPPLALSGERKRLPGRLIIRGPRGKISLSRGVIVAKRHLHISPQDAQRLGLKHLAKISVRVAGERGAVFENVVVRSRPGLDKMSFMLDTDEANAAGVRSGDRGIIVKTR